MRSLLIMLSYSAFLVLAVRAPGVAQSPCKTPSGVSQAAIRDLKRIVVSGDSGLVAIRSQYNMGSIDSAQVVLVADSTLCAQGVSAMNTAQSSAPVATEAFVYALGSSFYVVDRGGKSSESRARAVLLFAPSWSFVGLLGVSAYPADPPD